MRTGLASLRASAAGPGLTESVAAYRPRSAAPAAASAPSATMAEQLPNGLLAHVEASDDSRVFAVHLAFRPRAAS